MRNFWKIGVVVILVGCSGRPGAIHPPKVNPSAAAAAAIEQYDRNGDGKLAKDEWGASPALASVAMQYDQNGDGSLSAEEIEAGIATWQKTGIGARTVPFQVQLNG